ncbi:hypothetical protein G7046_g2522 [Stylonectria norvegica]|nr:hypothetical protein G7046_g2522 [Stylonectria norvegica]
MMVTSPALVAVGLLVSILAVTLAVNPQVSCYGCWTAGIKYIGCSPSNDTCACAEDTLQDLRDAVHGCLTHLCNDTEIQDIYYDFSSTCAKLASASFTTTSDVEPSGFMTIEPESNPKLTSTVTYIRDLTETEAAETTTTTANDASPETRTTMATVDASSTDASSTDANSTDASSTDASSTTKTGAVRTVVDSSANESDLSDRELGTAAKAGIGIAVAFGALGLVAFAATLWVSRQRRKRLAFNMVEANQPNSAMDTKENHGRHETVHEVGGGLDPQELPA